MPDHLSPESADAVHKAKNAAQAVEMARDAQVQEALAKFSEQNNKQLLSILKEVFGESDAENPTQMKILVRRIPILCTNIENMHRLIEEMRANQTWVVRLIIGGVIAAVMALVLK
jgi:hypothetical protein